MPTVRKIKDRLAVIETDIFLEGKKLAYENFKKENPQVKNFKQIEELDTIPNKLMEATSNFGVFTDNLKSEYCKNDPLAPHRYMKDLSQAMGRYVCACEFWEPKK